MTKSILVTSFITSLGVLGYFLYSSPDSNIHRMVESLLFLFGVTLGLNIIFALPFLAVAKRKNWISIRSFVLAALVSSIGVEIILVTVIWFLSPSAENSIRFLLSVFGIISIVSVIDSLILRWLVLKIGYLQIDNDD